VDPVPDPLLLRKIWQQQHSHIQSNTQANLDLWNTASTSNTEILERFQSEVLCTTVDAPWYVTNMVIRRDLHTLTAEEEIRHYSSQYSARLSVHPNDLVVDLMAQPNNGRLRRHLPNDLINRFIATAVKTSNLTQIHSLILVFTV
jgi:hypothetical protein